MVACNKTGETIISTVKNEAKAFLVTWLNSPLGLIWSHLIINSTVTNFTKICLQQAVKLMKECTFSHSGKPIGRIKQSFLAYWSDKKQKDCFPCVVLKPHHNSSDLHSTEMRLTVI